MPAVRAYTAGMKNPNESRKIQYTIRAVPEHMDKLLRKKAAEYGTSLNETALKVLQRGLGQDNAVLNHNFDGYAGTWVQEDAFDEVMKDFEKIDAGMWQ